MNKHTPEETLAHYRGVLVEALQDPADYDENVADQFTKLIAEQVHAEVWQFYSDLSTTEVGHVVECALSKIAVLLRRGSPVTLEHIGTLLPADVVGDRRVIFRPCKTLFEHIGDPPRLVVLDDSRKAQGGNHD